MNVSSFSSGYHGHLSDSLLVWPKSEIFYGFLQPYHLEAGWAGPVEPFWSQHDNFKALSGEYK